MNEFSLNVGMILWFGVITIPVIALFLAILLDFVMYDRRSDTKKSKRSLVATGTMVLFYVIYVIAIRLRWLELHPYLPDAIRYLGVVLLYLGSALNILGRFLLKSNWANHIKIYSDQTLVTSSIYGIVRHPLYSSLFLMMFAGALIFSNAACFLLTLFGFIPMMYYRAKQEEKLLIQEFPQYPAYMKKTGMFFPRLWR